VSASWSQRVISASIDKKQSEKGAVNAFRSKTARPVTKGSSLALTHGTGVYFKRPARLPSHCPDLPKTDAVHLVAPFQSHGCCFLSEVQQPRLNFAISSDR